MCLHGPFDSAGPIQDIELPVSGSQQDQIPVFTKCASHSGQKLHVGGEEVLAQLGDFRRLVGGDGPGEELVVIPVNVVAIFHINYLNNSRFMFKNDWTMKISNNLYQLKK